MDEERIEQFKKMAEADPDNELGHFSLGKAYLDAERYAEAIGCFERVIDLNTQNSKAYQYLAQAQTASGDSASAISTLRIGFDVANERGDIMPRNEITNLMRELGETPPEVSDPAPPAPSMPATDGRVACKRCGESKPPMPERPFKGPLGEQVLASICADCWQEWIHMGTKVINELRLDFSNPRDSDTYDQHMREFLNLAEA